MATIPAMLCVNPGHHATLQVAMLVHARHWWQVCAAADWLEPLLGQSPLHQAVPHVQPNVVVRQGHANKVPSDSRLHAHAIIRLCQQIVQHPIKGEQGGTFMAKSTDQLVASVRPNCHAHICFAFLARFWIFVVVKGLHTLCCCSIIPKQPFCQALKQQAGNFIHHAEAWEFNQHM